MKIVVLEASRIGKDISFDSLKNFGELQVYDETNTYIEAQERLIDADILIVDQFPINEFSLCTAKNLKYITMTSTGTNFVDFNYTNSHNITVANIRNYSTHSVAQHTISILLYLYEKLAVYDQYVKSGAYINDNSNSSFSNIFHELYGKEYGIVGMGNIGKEVAHIANAFGCHVRYYSPSHQTYPVKYESISLETLLTECDIISVHTPLTPQTEKMFTYQTFSKMKPSAIFINTSRGGIVDESGLVQALKDNKIAAAGLDVLTEEPMSSSCPFIDTLYNSRLFITPHMGWAAKESRQRAIMEIYENIKSYLNGTDRNIVK